MSIRSIFRVLILLFAFVWLGLAQSWTEAQAVTLDSCSGLGVTPYPGGNPPAGALVGQPIPISVQSKPSVSMSTDPSNPNYLIINQNPGRYTYQIPTICFVHNDPPPLQWYTYWGYLTSEGSLYGNLNTNGIPSAAIVSNSIAGSTIDKNKLSSDQCNLDISYNDVVPDNLVPVKNCTPSSSVIENPKSPKERCLLCEIMASIGDPIDTYSTNYVHHETDLVVQGMMPLGIVRSYYSGKNTTIGEFGVGSYLESYNDQISVSKNSSGQVILTANTQLKYKPGNGTVIIFTNPNGGKVFTNNGAPGTTGDTLTLSTDSTGKLTGAVYEDLENNRQIFDAHGRQTQLKDRYGNKLTFTRDSSGKLTSILDVTTQRRIDLTYNTAGQIAQVMDNTGRKALYTYSTAKELLTVTNPAGKKVTYAWTADHRIKSKTDWKGVVQMTNTYGSTGMVTRQIQADGAELRVEAPSSTERKVIQDNGGIKKYFYNAQGYMVESKDALGNDSKNALSSLMFTNTASGRYTQSTDPLGRVTRTDLNGNNLPVLITDALGQKTTITYDATHPEKVSTVTDPLGHKTSFAYDAAGNLTGVTDNAGNVSTMTYNSRGQILTSTNPLGQKSTYAYDSLGQLSSATNALGQKVQYGYDSLGRMTTVTDPKGNVTTLSYDSLDRLSSTKNALGQITTLSYDADGNLVSKTDARGKVYSLSYDKKSRLSSKKNGNGETSSFAYSGSDQLIYLTDPHAQQTSYTYDLADRLTQTKYADYTTYQYTYDAAGQLLKVNDSQTQFNWGFTYDKLGRVSQTVAPIWRVTETATVNYSYDANSKVTQLTSPQYGTVNYSYDTLDRMTGITKDSKKYSYTYDPLGKRTSLTRPNGVVSVYEYDAGNRLTALTHAKGTTVLERYEYTYDANGNIVKSQRGQGTLTSIQDVPVAKGSTKKVVGYTRNAPEELEKRFTYDALNRLTNVVAIGYVPGASTFATATKKTAALSALTQAKAATTATALEQALKTAEANGAVIPENATWIFDANGNIATKVIRKAGGALETRTFTYDSADRLVKLVKSGATTATITYTYDPNGNMLSDSAGRKYTWNAQNQLMDPTGGPFTSNRYDPFGRRYYSEVSNALKSYLLSGQTILSAYSILDSVTIKFLPGAGLDETLQLENSSLSASYLQDHLGSTSQLVSSTTGGSLTRYDFKAYGKLEGDLANPQPANIATYTGRQDDGNGLMYYRARFYDPELERFINDDPLGDAQRYVKGNPLRFIDPLGLDAMQDFSDYTAGFADSGSYGISQYLRNTYNPNGTTFFDRKVDTSSAYYKAGEVTPLVVGGARLLYAGAAKALPCLVRTGGTELEHALTVSSARNTLKLVARGGAFPNYRMYTAEQVLAKYGPNPSLIIEAATRTNTFINSLGAFGVAGYYTHKQVTKNEDGKK